MTSATLAEALRDVALVDHHCHGLVTGELNRPAFEALINEGFDPAPAGTSHADSPVGLAIRRWCAPILGLEPLASIERYLERRREVGSEEASRRLLAAAGLDALLIDSGYRSGEVLDPQGMAALSGVPTFEVVRLEAVAEELARDGLPADSYAETFRERLRERARDAVGLKTIVAYRVGLGFDPARPSAAEVGEAAARWFDAGGGRLEDPVLLRFGIWAGADVAREAGLPLQIHTGWGDPDLTLHLADPSLLSDLLKTFAGIGVTVVLLHCYPYHRQAAYLAHVLPNVYFDVGEALTYLGAGSTRLLAEALELAPFTKQLYSSDAFGLPELYALGGMLFRRGLASVLGSWVDAGDCSNEDAQRIARLIGAGNARRIYPLGG